MSLAFWGVDDYQARWLRALELLGEREDATSA